MQSSLPPWVRRGFSAACVWLYIFLFLLILSPFGGAHADCIYTALMIAAAPAAYLLPARVRLPWALFALLLLPVSFILFRMLPTGYLNLLDLARGLGLPADGERGYDLIFADRMLSYYHLPVIPATVIYLIRHRR